MKRNGGSHELTPRERQLLRAMLKAADTSNKGLGQLLGISHKTVDTHLKHIMLKMRVRTRTAAILRWITMTAVFLVCLPCFAQPKLHIFRQDFYVAIGVEDPESQQSVDVQMSTDMVHWQYTDWVHYYEGWGHQTNWVSLFEPGSRFFRLVPVSTNASFMVVTSAAKPASNFEAWTSPINGQEKATMVYSNDCITATISFRVPPGTWRVEHNGDLRGRWQVIPSCINGDEWRRLATIVGPKTNSITLALPSMTPGFLRLRKI